MSKDKQWDAIEKVLDGPDPLVKARANAVTAKIETIYVSTAGTVQDRIEAIMGLFHVSEDADVALTASQTAHNERLQKSLDFWMDLQKKTSGVKR